MKLLQSTIFQVLLVFIITLGVLFAVGAVPEEIKGFFQDISLSATSMAVAEGSESSNASGIATESDPSVMNSLVIDDLEAVSLPIGPKPERLIIKKIAVDSEIHNPLTRDVSVLDEALSMGIVNYPSSASLETAGNILLFGHSTNWTTVQNLAYKSLNGLETLTLGDEVLIQAGGREYVYRVFSVNLSDAETSLVNLLSDRRIVTISTCDTFGKKTDRVVVQAVYERDYNI